MMTLLLILVVVALLLAPALFKQNPRQLAAARVGLSLMALTLMVLRFTTCSIAPVSRAEQTYSRYWAVGWRLGVLLAEDYPDGGRVHVFLAPPKSPGIEAVNDSQLAGLEAGVGNAAFEFVVRTPAGRHPADMGGNVEGETPMEDCLKECEGAQAVVSFVNLPLNSDQPYPLPPAYVMDNFSTGYWISAMKAGRVGGAVTPHLNPSDMDYEKENGRPEERFNAIFRLFTPETVDTFKKPGMH